MSWWRSKPVEDERLKHPEFLGNPIEHLLREKDRYKALLYDAWKALAQQQKGMRRMSRKIKRLHRELAEAKRGDR